MSKIEICQYWAAFYYQRYFFQGRKRLDWKMAMKYHDKAILLMAGAKNELDCCA